MRIAKLERAYGAFVRCHELVAAAGDEPQLLRSICSVAVEELGYTLAWVGLVSGNDTTVKPAAQAGYEHGYLSSIHITWSEGPHGEGPTGRAIRRRMPQIARDIATDPRFEPWRKDALERGYASSAALPLCDGTACLGALNLYAAEPDAFDDDEIALLQEVATDLVLGLSRLRARRRLAALHARIDEAEQAESAAVATGAVAHDLRNLLNTALVSIEMASSSAEERERKGALEDALEATSRAAALTQQLTSLSRRAASGDQYVHVDQVVSGAMTLLDRLAPNAQLHFDLTADSVAVSMSKLDLERILINLVVNASHALDAPGNIVLHTELLALDRPRARHGEHDMPAGSYVAVTVTDDGRGIAQDVLPRIFEPYFTTKGDQGSGLGLAAALALARAAGGEIEVASHLGEGARFTVLLPMRKNRASD